MNKKDEYIKSNVKDSKIISFLFEELETMTKDIVIKLDYRARKYETNETREQGTIFIEAVNRLDVFETYQFYEGSILNKIGLGIGTVLSSGEVVTREMFENFSGKPYTIPFEYRKLALEEKRNLIINNYEEKNAYYRELNGQPPLDEDPKKFVRYKEKIPEMGDLNLVGVPLHEFPSDVLIKMKISGALDEAIEEHRDQRYLKHLLDMKIPISISRKASNYSILYINKPKHQEVLADRFISLYMKTLNYVKYTIYDNSFKSYDTYYDAFIGLFILVITIQRFIVNYFKSGIKREFFSKEIIQMYFDSYGIPFYSDIALSYLSKIAKNLNYLLLYKSTDQIFVNIFDLFGLKDSKIYKYFLLKERRVDKDGNPIYEYKTITDDQGQQKQVYDLKAMYDLRFVSIPSDSKQLSVDIIDKSNYIDYDLVVEDDVLWGGDGDKEEFIDKILEAEFNYVETKYISMTSKYELSKLGFELCYFFKMVDDLKPEEDNLRIVTPLGTHKLFNVFVTLFALASIQMHFDGNIMDTGSKVLHVLGFNFNKDMDYINKVIKDINTADNIIIDDRPEIFKSKSDMLNFYFNNKHIYDTVLKNRKNSKSIEEFNAYSKLYQATMITTYTNDMYKLKDGTTARTYVDFLEENDVNLFKYVKETNHESVVENLDNILMWLEDYFKTDKFDNIFLNIPTLSLDSIKRFIYYLIDIFKSYTVDLISMNIIYHMGDPYTELIKILSSEDVDGYLELYNNYIKINDKTEYPIPFFLELQHYLHLREETLPTVFKTEFNKILLSEDSDLSIVTELDRNNIYPSAYIFENLKNETDRVEHDNIKIKDYLFIEEA